MEFRVRIGGREIVAQENFFDRALRYVAPGVANRRMASRLQFAAASSFTGGSRTKRSLARWRPGGGSADADLLPDLAELRERSRDLVRNEPLASGAVAGVVTNVVGTGLMPKFLPRREILGWSEERAAKWKTQVEQEFAVWAESTACDAARGQTFYGLQDLIFRSALENGDAFALLVMRTRPGARYQTAVQLVEADRVSNKDGTRDTPKLAGGVELDADGAPVRYHIRNEHPGDLQVGRTWSVVDAFGEKSGRRNVLHLYDKLRIGQTRGAPYLTPVVEHIKQIGRFSEAEVFAAVANAMFALKVKSPDKSGLAPLESAVQGTAPATGTSDAAESNWDGTLTPGLTVDFGENEDVTSFMAGRPNPEFDPFVQAFCTLVGVGLELPQEVLLKKFMASYSAARSALLEAWKFYRKKRYRLAEMFCQPAAEVWLAEAVARGFVDAPGFFADPLLRYAYCYATWHGDGPGSIDPLKEAQAVEKRLSINLRTLAQEIAEDSGGDVDSVLEQRGRERERERELGLDIEPKAERIRTEPQKPEGSDSDREDVRGVHVHLAEKMEIGFGNQLAAAINAINSVAEKQAQAIDTLNGAVERLDRTVAEAAQSQIRALAQQKDSLAEMRRDLQASQKSIAVQISEGQQAVAGTYERIVAQISAAVRAAAEAELSVAKAMMLVAQPRKAVYDAQGNLVGVVPVAELG